MNGKIILFLLACGMLLLQFSCTNQQKPRANEINRNYLQNVRLGDGIPLSLDVTLRWKVEDPNLFFSEFSSTDTFNSLVLIPRSLELAKQESNRFESVDSVFSVERESYIESIKSVLKNGLASDGMSIREVIISDIIFPQQYIGAKEEVGLKEQELERIRQQKIVNIEKAKALKEQASADGQVEIARAEAEGKVQEIKSKTEKIRRKNEIAIAETEAQVARFKAKTEADRNRELADAEVEKVRDLKNVEVQKKREIEQIAVDKVAKLDKVDFERQLQLARLCAENPTYASFLVNKELASKVEIAVLPTGTGQNVFENIINHRMPK